MRARDTSRRAHEVQRAAQRALGPAARVELAIEMSEQARELALRGALSRSPETSESEAREVILRRFLGHELFEAAWAAKPRT